MNPFARIGASFTKLASGLAKTRQVFQRLLVAANTEELEEALLATDVGVKATEILVEKVRHATGDRREVLETEIARLLNSRSQIPGWPVLHPAPPPGLPSSAVPSPFQAEGNWPRAEELYREALTWTLMLPPGPLAALSLTHLGDAARQRRDYYEALRLYQEALELDEAKKDRLGRAVRWERLGRTYLEMGDYAQAASYFNQALAVFREQEATRGIIDALEGLTLLALARGDRTEAAIQGEKLLKLYQARGQAQEEARLKARVKEGRARP